ncbi:MAG: bifunctional DNA-formamidopyrimidine glycosylase/DNA-(apurinic or apyrimidinic site) lyase [Bryobacteraceae bacterium]
MPELPEVESVARSLAPLVGRRIVNAEFTCLRVLRGDPERMAEQVAGRQVTAIRRHGKFLVLELEGVYMAVHLGMTGRLLLDASRGRHTHAVFTLDRGALLYDDSRQFGCIEVGAVLPARVERLGPDASQVDFETFYRGLRVHRAMIKPLLLNQKFLRGLGNIYADEALFRAGVHPRTLASRLGLVRAERLHRAILAVLWEAIEAGGSSISDYVDAEGRKGLFQISHRVYQKTGEPCPVCGTPIRRTLVAQRGTHFCPRCQRR